MSFQNLSAGDKVKFWAPNGIGPNGPEKKLKTAKVQMLLVFADHVVVNMGGKYGTPFVVDASNYAGMA